MPFVVDASVALAWHFEDEPSLYADRVLERLREEGAVAPSIWPLEMANGLVIAERRGRLTPAKRARAVELTIESPVLISETGSAVALGPVLDLARVHGLTAYDAAYLELAMREGPPLATEDASLRAAAERVGVALVE